MKKKCICCDQEIDTEINMNTKIFLICEKPCICSDCLETLFDEYSDKRDKIDNYKHFLLDAIKAIIFKYPENWDEENDIFWANCIVETSAAIGKEVTTESALKGLNNAKKRIDLNKDAFEKLRKKNRYYEPEELEFVKEQTPEIVHVMEMASDICNSVYEVVPELAPEPAPSHTPISGNTIRDIVNKVKEDIKGQDAAVEEIGRIIYHNQQCARYNDKRNISDRIMKENMILVGPTGTGKTATVTRYCELMKIPYVIADMTAYTKAGYVGADIEDIFTRLLKNADDNIKLAQNGIVIMDEGDKNEAKESGRDIDVGGKGVIDSLLKKIEGCDIVLGKGKVFNSTNTTFITMGVYPKLYEIRKTRMTGRRSIGFSSQMSEVLDYGEFIADDFVKHGFSQEYIGRFSAIVELNSLSDEVYLDILRDSKSSALKQYASLFKYSYDVDLVVTHEGESSIINKAKTYNIGARGLQRALAKLLSSVETQLIMSEKKCDRIVITEDCKIIMD